MSDDRLFASNNAIGRKWYFINLILLAGISYGINWGFTNYILENTTNDAYSFIAKFMEYFVYIILFITLLSLIDRRLYDVSGDRRKSSYKNISTLLAFCIFFEIAAVISANTQFTLPIPSAVVQQLTYVFAGVFAAITVLLGLPSGQISNLSYEKYRQKIKYE